MYAENNFIRFLLVGGKCKKSIQKAKEFELICVIFFELYS